MWLPSFYSVLIDLWRFIWPASAGVPYAITPRTGSSLAGHTQRSTPIVVAVDPVSTRPVSLATGVMYTDQAPETLVIRKVLHTYDSHLVRVGNLTLIEWLLYTIHRADSSLSLLALAMTPVGRWFQTLKAQPGVRVSIEPTTGALMEWVATASVSKAGIIKQVSPDQTITLQTISEEPVGTYQESTMSVAVWKELGPVFTRFRV